MVNQSIQLLAGNVGKYAQAKKKERFCCFSHWLNLPFNDNKSKICSIIFIIINLHLRSDLALGEITLSILPLIEDEAKKQDGRRKVTYGFLGQLYHIDIVITNQVNNDDNLWSFLLDMD